MSARHRRPVRTGLCLLAALVLTTVTGAVARADTPATHTSAHGKRIHTAAVAVQPQVKATYRAPVGLDAVPADAAPRAGSVATSVAAESAAGTASGVAVRAEHSRDPPGGELV